MNKKSGYGMGGVFLRGDTWHIRYSFHGRKRRESSGSTVRADAVKLLKKRLAEMASGRLTGPDVTKTTFEDLRDMVLTDYDLNARKSTRRVRLALDHLRDSFALSHLTNITSDRISSYIKQRQADGASPASIRYELTTLKRGFALAMRAGKADARPYVPSIRVDNARKGFFEAADFEAVVGHLSADLAPLMRFLHITGWRAGEALGLNWACVDFEAGVVRLEPGTTKNGDGREFPMGAHPQLKQLLTERRERTTELERMQGKIIQPVFHRNGRRIASYTKAWRDACTAAGVSGRLVHDLRRTAVRSLERLGVPHTTAMKITGHKTASVYMRYAIASNSDVSDAVAKLSQLHAAPLSSRSTLPFPSKGPTRAQSAG